MATPFHIYLDLEVLNDDTINTGRHSPPLSFEETRTQAFLDGDASEHFCTIARFTLQTGNSLPLFIPIIDTNQVPPPPDLVPTYPPQNKTIYTITLRKQPDSSNPAAARLCLTQPVIYEPHDRTLPLPSPPYGRQDLSSEYYHMRSYQDFINMINETLLALSAQLPLRAASCRTTTRCIWSGTLRAARRRYTRTAITSISMGRSTPPRARLGGLGNSRSISMPASTSSSAP